MSKHQKFNYGSIEDLIKDIKDRELGIPVSDSLEALKRPLEINGRIVPNRLAVHPMEGCDGTAEGAPDELVFRRYERFAKGGAGLQWYEATAVVREGRANPRQLYINENTAEAFKSLLDKSIEAGRERLGEDFRPYTVLQLTHSGRYSRPELKPEPIIAARNPYLDKNIPEDYPLVTDEYLEELEDKFVEAAKLAAYAGFDAVDIKSCHRYLNSELLSAFTREGRYGGSFENRTRFLLNIIDKIKASLGGKIDITLRMNAYDAIPYPYGWGVDREDFHKPDLSEPKKLIKILGEKGVKLINVSIGNPYYNPHVGRPFDIGPYTPPQHPLEGVAKLLGVMKELQQSAPGMAIMATGFSWLREYAANIAAGCVEKGWLTIAGFGRQAFAYPDFAHDILKFGKLDRKKCCIACSNCSVIMRDGGKTGCVPKDGGVYLPIYKEGREGKPPAAGNQVAEHV